MVYQHSHYLDQYCSGNEDLVFLDDILFSWAAVCIDRYVGENDEIDAQWEIMTIMVCNYIAYSAMEKNLHEIKLNW